MPGITDSFGVALTAYTTLDKPSLDKAGKSIGDALGKKTSTAGTDQVDKKVQGLTATTSSWAKRISDVKEQLRVDWHTSGLGKTVDQFRDARTAVQEFHDQAEKTGKLFGSVGAGVFGLAGLAGIGAAVERFGSASMQLRNTAGTLGVSTGMLQGFRGAAELAGLDQGAADAAIGNMQRSLFAAKWGMPEGAQALGAANILGLNVREDPTVFLEKLADKIKGQRDARVQEKTAQAFGVEGLLPVLRQGGAAIERLIEATKRHNYLSKEQEDQGNQLGVAYRGATQSISGMANAISAELSPSLTPMLDSFSKWLDDLKQSPDDMKLVSDAAEGLGLVLGGSLLVRVGLLTSKFIGLTAAIRGAAALAATAGGLLSLGGLGALTGIGAGLWGGWKGAAAGDALSGRMDPMGNPLGPETPGVNSPSGGGSSSWGAAWWNRLHPGNAAAPGKQGMSGQGNADPDSVFAAILKTENSQSGNQVSPAGATGPSQIMPDTWRRYAQPGEDINNRTDNLAVGKRIVADLLSKNPDPRQAAFAYNHGHFGSPQELDTSNYVQTFDKNFKSSALGTAGGMVQKLAGWVTGREFHAQCAIMLNKALVASGAPPLPSNIATLDAGYGSAVDPSKGQANDIAIAMNGLQPGQLGGHAMALAGGLQMHNGQMMYPVESTNTEDEHGNLLSVGGLRWRRPGELTIRRPQYPQTPIGTDVDSPTPGQTPAAPGGSDITPLQTQQQPSASAPPAAASPALPTPPPPTPVPANNFYGMTWDSDGTPHQAVPASDTSHHVIVDVNGPAGTRANVANSKGPADLTLRTQTAFSTP